MCLLGKPDILKKITEAKLIATDLSFLSKLLNI